MRSSDSWTEGRRDVLRAFAATLDRAQRAWMAAYVLASLLAATAGSLAALLLVPLIQPAAVLPVGGMVLDMDRGLGGNVAAFVQDGGHGLVLQSEAGLAEAFENGAVLDLSRTRRKAVLHDLRFSALTADLMAEAGE